MGEGIGPQRLLLDLFENVEYSGDTGLLLLSPPRGEVKQSETTTYKSDNHMHSSCYSILRAEWQRYSVLRVLVG